MIDIDESEVRFNPIFIGFINTCFGKINYEYKEYIEYPIGLVNDAFFKFTDMATWVFDYNCSDCSFPKFKNIHTGDTEACPLCGD